MFPYMSSRPQLEGKPGQVGATLTSLGICIWCTVHGISTHFRVLHFMVSGIPLVLGLRTRILVLMLFLWAPRDEAVRELEEDPEDAVPFPTPWGGCLHQNEIISGPMEPYHGGPIDSRLQRGRRWFRIGRRS